MNGLIIGILITCCNIAVKQDNFCKYDSILILEESEKITYKQVTKLAYYNQGSRYAIRRDYGKIDLIFSSMYNLQSRDFEEYQDREVLQSHFGKNDFILRIQLNSIDNSKFKLQQYPIGGAEDTIQCVVRLYHLDKTKQGTKIVSRKYKVKSGDITIERLTSRSFCGSIKLNIPQYYNLNSEFSVQSISKDD